MINRQQLKDLKLLIVEDEKKLSTFLKDAICEYFASVTLASNGEEGINKFNKIHPDVIITDIMMPKMDGLQMAKSIKEINKEAHIIVLSAFSEKEKLLKSIDVGINKYFIKPFDPDELLHHIDKIALKLHNRRYMNINKEFMFDKNSKNLYQKEQLVKLTPREREFFALLVQNANMIVGIELIKRTLWPKEQEISPERLRTFIKRVRIKTSKNLIDNISGQGYTLSKDNI
ncbi:response regulator transcription factor [Candidatus Marinarcus aquaticus]|uniref:DNA-binding response regulator n=1 Tax=Candidatus Marinarcus aquaticus TaxID=2044504 RepID=A0A4Q0XTP3_9BACT|nr:response regulator transcription factor [Candidatus Marinarcus aquaticus]RXJ60255.1 DNA-binding response regulator [Candidatus Marinarcus aquaticus]